MNSVDNQVKLGWGSPGSGDPISRRSAISFGPLVATMAVPMIAGRDGGCGVTELLRSSRSSSSYMRVGARWRSHKAIRPLGHTEPSRTALIASGSASNAPLAYASALAVSPFGLNFVSERLFQ